MGASRRQTNETLRSDKWRGKPASMRIKSLTVLNAQPDQNGDVVHAKSGEAVG
jgi:hypothetical protein